MTTRHADSTALAYALLAPSLFGVVAFLLLPILVVVWLSLYRWDLLGPMQYVGWPTGARCCTTPTSATRWWSRRMFVALVVPAQTVLGLLAALLLARRLPGSGLFRTLYVLPWICAPLAIAVLWRWILAPTDGAVSTLLGRRIEWLTDPDLALPVVVGRRRSGPTSAMSRCSSWRACWRSRDEIHDAARTDGANAWQRFWRITLPMLRPTMFFVLVTGIVSTAQVFDTVYALTGGGPEGSTDLVAHRIYAEAFGAAAIGPGRGDGGGAVRHPGRRHLRSAPLLPPADQL